MLNGLVWLGQVIFDDRPSEEGILNAEACIDGFLLENSDAVLVGRTRISGLPAAGVLCWCIGTLCGRAFFSNTVFSLSVSMTVWMDDCLLLLKEVMNTGLAYSSASWSTSTMISSLISDIWSSDWLR